ncbi:MAG: hypothetical protein J1E37_04775 [Prevotella sp.]|nr:hypothetical protein [Prevotella sp.]
MKKTYINPQMKVVTIELQQMLAASSMGFSDDYAPSAQSRGFGDDDDDWE